MVALIGLRTLERMCGEWVLIPSVNHVAIPERSLVAGVPGVVKRTFTEEELQRQKKNAAVYTDDASECANNVKIVG